ncbi:MAG: ABC transporter permease [Clostridia bacterium]
MLIQTIKMAFSAIFSNKMRSFLTMLGIIIGVISVVVLISLVNGAKGAIVSQISEVGSDLISVSVVDDRGAPLTTEDVKAFANEPEILSSAPEATVYSTVKSGLNNLDFVIYGTTPEYQNIRNVKIDYGRFLKQPDIDNASAVIVLDAESANEFFPEKDAVGATVSVNGRDFLVIGVLKEDKTGGTSFMSFITKGRNTAYIPYNIGSRMTNSPFVTTFYVSSADSSKMDKAENKLNNLLLNRFKQDKDAFYIVNQSTVMNIMDKAMSTMSLLLGGIAAISLVVGGIGIMNIMLVSVTERTREIGIRKAIGASRFSILTQFLSEALILSLFGGSIGLAFSWGILELIGAIAGDYMTLTMEFPVILTAMLFSVFIGVVFGLYPANKASKLKPIDALRYE